MVVRKAFASGPLRALSQQLRRSCRYAPRPASLPVGSIRAPSSTRTMRIRLRLGKTWRQPTQVRWGTCLGFRTPFSAILFAALVLLWEAGLPVSPIIFFLVLVAHHSAVLVRIVFNRVALLLLTLLLATSGYGFLFFCGRLTFCAGLAQAFQLE